MQAVFQDAAEFRSLRLAMNHIAVRLVLFLRRADTGEVGVGFLAPYAYFKVFLIDLANGEIEREQAVAASITVSVARNRDGLDPWDALDAAQKVSAIRRLIRRELDRVVPKLLR